MNIQTSLKSNLTLSCSHLLTRRGFLGSVTYSWLKKIILADSTRVKRMRSETTLIDLKNRDPLRSLCTHSSVNMKDNSFPSCYSECAHYKNAVFYCAETLFETGLWKGTQLNPSRLAVSADHRPAQCSSSSCGFRTSRDSENSLVLCRWIDLIPHVTFTHSI